MTNETPIVCSLTGDELAGRLADIRSLGQDALVASDEGGVLRFRGDPATRTRLKSIIAAESRCCPFLDFAVGEQRGELVLRIEAPPEGAAVVRELVYAFRGAA